MRDQYIVLLRYSSNISGKIHLCFMLLVLAWVMEIREGSSWFEILFVFFLLICFLYPSVLVCLCECECVYVPLIVYCFACWWKQQNRNQTNRENDMKLVSGRISHQNLDTFHVINIVGCWMRSIGSDLVDGVCFIWVLCFLVYYVRSFYCCVGSLKRKPTSTWNFK